MSWFNVARAGAKAAAPHFSVLKVFLDNLRKGRAWDAAGGKAFDLTKPSLMRNVEGRKAAVDDVVEAAGFDPGDLSYHGSYGLIDDFRVPKGDLGIHVTGDPMTAVNRGYQQRAGRDEIKDVITEMVPPKGVNSMQDLLRSFYDVGETANPDINLAKLFKGRPRPFSNEAMSKYDFEKFDDLVRQRTINPLDLGADYNVYPLLQRQGLRTMELPDVGNWKYPHDILKNLKVIGGQHPRYQQIGRRFSDAKEFEGKYRDELEDLWVNAQYPSPSNTAADQASRLKDIFEKEGIEAIDYLNRVEGAGELSRLILDPARNLRSPFAAFKGESGWMAGLLPLISLLRGQREE